MLVNNNDESTLYEYIEYLKDKGRITKIKDTSKNINIKLSSGILFYFLIIIGIALIILTIYLIGNAIVNSNLEGGNLIIVGGTALFTIIILGVAFNEKNNSKLNISYPNENQIKVNSRIFDIEKENCYIDIIKNYDYTLQYEPEGMHRSGYNTTKYFLKIKGKKILKSIEIKKGIEEQLKDFVYNFEYEISDFEKEKREILQNMQNQVENIYKNENQ